MIQHSLFWRIRCQLLVEPRDSREGVDQGDQETRRRHPDDPHLVAAHGAVRTGEALGHQPEGLSLECLN